MGKPVESKSISTITDPSNTVIEFVCKECGNSITPGVLVCRQCKALITSGMNPVLNTILSYALLTVIPCIIGSIIGMLAGNYQKGLLIGIIIGGFLATSTKRRVFNREGVWAMMRLGDSLYLGFYCPTSIWEKGILPILVYFKTNIINISKFQSQKLNPQEQLLFKKIIDAKINPAETKPSETKPNNTPENEQENQPIQNQAGNSTIKITRIDKMRGAFDIYDVYVDEKKATELKNGQTCKIDTFPGNHKIRIQVQGWSFWSNPYSFSMDANETINISCTPRFNEGPLIERIRDK